MFGVLGAVLDLPLVLCREWRGRARRPDL